MSDQTETENTTETVVDPTPVTLENRLFYTIAMLHDVDKDRYHPIIYKPQPTPSWNEGDPVRSKSMMHHTGGFDTHAEAMASASGLLITMRDQIANGEGNLANWASEVYCCLEKSFPWDGHGVPALINFFAIDVDKQEVHLMM